MKYCNKYCEIAHWNVHRWPCNSEVRKEEWEPSAWVERRKPTWECKEELSRDIKDMRDYWSSIPAVDVLKLLNNEGLTGVQVQDDLRVLLCGDQDLNTAIKTVVDLPVSFAGNLEIVLNDESLDTTARNAIILLSPVFWPTNAPSMMLHIWYSCLIPQQMFTELQHILPEIESIITMLEARNQPEHEIYVHEWTCNCSNGYVINISLRINKWKYVALFLRGNEDLTSKEAIQIRRLHINGTFRKDYQERDLWNKNPSWRLSRMRFNEDGILMPFAASCEAFDTPNPTLWSQGYKWPLYWNADPLHEWNFGEVMEKYPTSNDLHGNLHYFLVDLLTRFCPPLHAEINARERRFTVTRGHCYELPLLHKAEDSSLKSTTKYDRIYVSCAFHEFTTFSRLLKSKSQNPHATLLTYHKEAFTHATGSQHGCSPQFLQLLDPDLKRAASYYVNSKTPGGPIGEKSTPHKDILNHQSFARRYKELFETWVLESKLIERAKARGWTKETQTIVLEEWPCRLKDGASQLEFEAVITNNVSNVCDRFLECNRGGDGEGKFEIRMSDELEGFNALCERYTGEGGFLGKLKQYGL
ncbi:hypothetical protein BJ875DRAFT_424247 [Amylocarpus encephaloides]|uniref:DUF4470 domain-containing protein n=1 Tax=Amylocarpus encephaloides TaxID=45428 RepID=A0A9P8C5K6_9HELO|nr:hypothetical protein BJ875DRAFT_424247 [Amylocarpus encephaloides]